MATAIYLALATLVFVRLLHGETFFAGDVYRYHLPAWGEVRAQLRGGHWPVWNPSWSCGVPLLGALLPAALYPPVVLLALLLPAGLGFGLCVALHPPFAALGLALFLRRRGLGARAAVVGGAAFGFGGGMLALSSISPAALYTVSWGGWLLLLLDRLADRPGPGRAAALGLAGGITCLAGEPQQVVHLGLVVLGWALARVARAPGRARLAACLGASALVAGLLASATILPALDALSCGERRAALGYAQAATWPVLPVQLWTLLAPDLFGSNLRDYPNVTWLLTRDAYPYLPTLYLGALPLLAALAAPWAGRRRGLLLFCGAVALGFVLISLGEGFGAHRLLYELLPVYGRFRYPYKAWFAASLGVAGLSALGLDALLRARASEAPGARRAALVAAGLAGALLLLAAPLGRGALRHLAGWLAAGQPPELVVVLERRLVHAALGAGGCVALAALGLSRLLPARAGAVAIATVAVLELGAAASPAVATAAAAQVAPDLPPSARSAPLRLHATPRGVRHHGMERFRSLAEYAAWATREARIPNTARWAGAENFRGDDKVYALWHGRLITLSERLSPPARLRLLAACGVEELVSQLPPGPELEVVADLGAGLSAARLPRAFPRAFWTPTAAPVAAQTDALRALLMGEVDLGHAALVPDEAALATRLQAGAGDEEPPGLEPEHAPGPRVARAPLACALERPSPVEVRVAAPGQAGVVVLLDAWFPGWTVTVDGHERPLLRADYAFRGVRVAAGEREVVFRYRAFAPVLGRWLALAGLLLALGLALGSRLRPAPGGGRST
ncbi:MAG: hypothetical protein AB7N76_25555 [Planctomycetota bacterium]